MIDRYQPLLKFFITSALVFVSSVTTAQLSASLSVKFLVKDSSIHNLIAGNGLGSNTFGADAVAMPVTNPAKEPLWNNLDKALKQPDERKQLLNYLKSIEVENIAETRQAKARFYYRLANTFARLRLYPLAMKCFLKTVPKQREPVVNTPTLLNSTSPADTAAAGLVAASYLSINNNDDSLINKYAADFKVNSLPIKSKRITYQRVKQTFDDGKKAIAYAMLFHVKQPVRGKRKIFIWTNVGHTFITLIKYNADSTYTSVSLGFYPKKDNLLSATPLIPTTSSTFKDDAGHEWDEVLGKFISKRRFERIQGLILQYNAVKYNLSKNNCTDFGIKAAELAGIRLLETYGTWPLGKGNNPAITGQAILDGKYNTTDADGKNGLFVDLMPDNP